MLWEEQSGIVTRNQALLSGITPDAIRAQLQARRWQTIHSGVFATFTGPLPRPAQLWAAQLKCGPGAVLSHRTAAVLHRLIEDDLELPIDVTVPSERRVRRVKGVRLHYSRWLAKRATLRNGPIRTRVDPTVIDLAEQAESLDEAVGWLTRAIGRRATTAERLAVEIADRLKVRRREELVEALTDAGAGCHSVLEWRYLREVERPHGLPTGVRQRKRVPQGVVYDDIAYAGYGLIVELDGRGTHAHTQLRDLRRDNASAVTGSMVLRYGYEDVSYQPCVVATQVAEVLRLLGWTGSFRRCRRCSEFLP